MARIAARARGRLKAGRLRGMASLGGKLVLIMTAVGVIGSIAITVLLASVITPNFQRLESTAIGGHVDRTRAVLVEFASKVESAVRDYGDWNSSYDYMAHPTRAFEHESFSTLAMVNLGVNGMAYVGNDGHVVIARWLDVSSGRDNPDERQRLIDWIEKTDFSKVLGTNSSTNFYVRFGREVAAVGVAKVRRSDGSGTPRGYVLMARRITSAQLAQLLQLDAHVDLAAPADHETIVPARRTMTIAVPIRGLDGDAVANARFTVPRDVSLLGQRVLLLAVAGSTLLFLVVLLVLRRMITRLVLRPLHRVESHMQKVTASGSLGLLQEDGRDDEIGSLNRSFNTMLRQLKDLREQVELQSFALGKSESAVAVMHNVRNALNPVSTILSRGVAEQASIDRATLDRAVAELARGDIPPARRQKLAAFVAAAVEAEAANRLERRQQLQQGREAMSHVLEIIGAQQAEAHERPQLEACDLSDIVAQNATIARYSDATSIAFSFPAKPCLVLANRLILSQVIGNLFGNAAEAIAAKGTGSGSITVTERRDGERVELIIRDDGEGFDPAATPGLFQRGFSTRGHKSGGLGLHWCANSVNAMEGALRLESEGRGKGARAVLSLRAAEGARELAA
jgi:signal transduction histidine kinase